MAATAFFSTLSFSVYRLIFEKRNNFYQSQQTQTELSNQSQVDCNKTCYQINKNRIKIECVWFDCCFYVSLSLVRHLYNLHKFFFLLCFTASTPQVWSESNCTVQNGKKKTPTRKMSKSDATEEEFSVEKVLNRRVRNGKVSFSFFLFLSFIIPFLL